MIGFALPNVWFYKAKPMVSARNMYPFASRAICPNRQNATSGTKKGKEVTVIQANNFTITPQLKHWETKRKERLYAKKEKTNTGQQKNDNVLFPPHVGLLWSSYNLGKFIFAP